MSTTTRVRTRSNSNANLVDHQALVAVKKENRARNRKKGKNAERKQPAAAINVGEVAWDRMFAQGSFKLPPTKFMDKVKAAVSEEDLEHIKKEILNTLKDEKDYICSGSYSSLPEATNKIYAMLTEILVQEVGQAINYDIQVINQEKGELKKKMSQIDYDTSRANAIKSSRDQLIPESKSSTEDLLKAVQEERRKEVTNDANMTKLRDDTATRIQALLQRSKLPTVLTGTRKSADETPMFENELQTLSQDTGDKLTRLEQIQVTITKLNEQENQIREKIISSQLHLSRSMVGH